MRTRRSILLLVALTTLIAAAPGAAATKRYARPHVELQVDSSGRIVAAVGGGGGERAAVARLLPDGRLDPTLAGDGTIGPWPSSEPAALALQRSGRIFVAAQRRGQRPLLRKYRRNGLLDRSFGKKGAARIPVVPTGRLLAQPDGHVMALVLWTCPSSSCGYTYHYIEMRRYSPNGREVTRKTHYQELWEFDAVDMDPAGRLVIAGSDYDLGFHTFGRFRPDGSFDPSLGGREGLEVREEDYYEPEPGQEALPSVSDLAIQPDGAFVLASQGEASELRRRNRNGSVDHRFGVDGVLTCAPVATSGQPQEKEFVSVASTAAGDLVATGGRAGCGLVRYLPDGSPDPGFGSNGGVDLEALGLPRALALALGPEGEIVLAGWDATTRTVSISRFSSTGQLDGGFGINGTTSLAGF